MTGAVEGAVRHELEFSVRYGSFTLVASTTVGLSRLKEKRSWN
jgi:hypothetical protein